MQPTRLGILAVLTSVLANPAIARAQDRPAVPVIVGPWWRIAGNPDLGPLTSENQEPVDFGVWRARDGSWQLWSCIRKTNEVGHTRLFYRWQGRDLTDSDWAPMGIVMRGDPRSGESPGGLQAPHVVRHEGVYHMFYGDWENICLATSRDGKTFRRASFEERGPQLFTDGSGNKTRDPMLIPFGDHWYCYYSAGLGEGGIFARKSARLTDWSASSPKRVCAGGSPGSQWWNAECPHVIFRDGFFYLFRTSRYKDEPATTVYRSEDPIAFGIHDDSNIVTTLPVAAPEIQWHDGRDYIACLTPDLDGIRVARLDFVADN